MQLLADLERRALSHLIRLGALVCLVLLATPQATAEAQSAVLRTDPPGLEVGQGQVETLNIILENAQEVYGIEVRASFDPAVVEVVDADAEKEGVQMTPGGFIQPDFLVRNTADNQAGTLQYVTTQVNPSPPANGSGVVLAIQFRGKALGAQSGFAIDFVDIADRRGIKLSVQPQSGSIRVVPPKPATPTPTPGITPDLAAANSTPVPQPAGTPLVLVSPGQVGSATPLAGPGSYQAPPVSRDAGNRLLSLLVVMTGLGGCLGVFVLLVVVGLLLFLRSPLARVDDWTGDWPDT